MGTQTYFPTNGTTADGTGVNDNFIEIFGNITNVNIAASAGIVFSKLDSATVAGVTASQTLTNKTLTAPVLGGSITGTYTLAGTPTITAPILSGSVTGTYTLAGTPTLSGTFAGTPTYSGVPLFSVGASITGAQKLSLNAGVTTYFTETSAGDASFIVGSTTAMEWTTTGVQVGASHSLNVAGAQKLGLNNGLTTYLVESSAGDASFIVGSAVAFEATTTQFLLPAAQADTTASAANCVLNITTGRVQRSTSSIKYKEDVVDLEFDSSKIYDLRPVSFTSKMDKKRYFGLIAEEVEAYLPELVEHAPDGSCEGVNYAYLSVLLLNELKKLKNALL